MQMALPGASSKSLTSAPQRMQLYLLLSIQLQSILRSIIICKEQRMHV